MAELPVDIKELINNAESDSANNIPTGYQVGENRWLYKVIEKGKGENKYVVPKLITSTPPFITQRFRDIETNEFTYELTFDNNNKTYKMPVYARELVDNIHLIGLANRGFDVTTTNRNDLVNYISMYMRMNPLPITSVVTRLGHIKNHFIHPLNIDSDMELVIHEAGYKEIADQFQTKGTLQAYAQSVFKPILDSNPTMMFLYASCGSILLHDFNVEPFVVDLSGASSRGKTTALKVASSVWGKQGLVSEWNITRVGIERKSAFLNSFPLYLDDSRKANPYMIADVVYQFSGGREKGRGNKRSIDVERTWQNIMISTGETSLADNGNEKAGIGARVVTLQENPFADNVSFIDLYEGINNQYGTLGLAFIEQYQSDKETYYASFKRHEKRLIEKAGSNEIMARIGRAFALLQVAGEIINDIDGFEHDPYITIAQAYSNMLETNKNIDKPKQLLESLLEKLDAERNHITGANYGAVFNGVVKAVFNKDYLCILTDSVKSHLGHEFHTITTEWRNRGYLATGKESIVRQVKYKGVRYRGYAIKTSVIEEFGFDFKKESY
ncbi:hypothetical protein TP70_06460 [Staphylococcus microti]|uniref:Pathogenicity island protein n=3 Tax=Staphylococcus TaxID=1279 RepID=A0A0D6XS49_9STAP|nr:DUF927 domain-containing protein [Staphylococcus microti]KIX90653.1 hypothetical protein TP70_06460 [Staphylococcus microti]PNZ83868.1 DUF927 domain-containing protein [Staphylococcus microti]SUM56605.1 pathogenicity island protein [Staphylococcus microti]SUN02115.1 pathogenicity island protein [Staphylococcus microti]SUN02136.1 pathogenicity island protein [Staphylococcus microti]